MTSDIRGVRFQMLNRSNWRPVVAVLVLKGQTTSRFLRSDRSTDWSSVIVCIMKIVEKTIAASEFKAKCLRLLDETWRKGREYTITKKGQPIARVLPIHKKQGTLRGSLKGLAEIKGDIVHFDTSEDWEALQP